jgi:hypothetical protein
MPFSPVDIFALLAALGLFAWAYGRRSSRNTQNTQYPPGPPGLPIIGNLLNFPRSSQSVEYERLGKEYGQLLLSHPL